MKIEHSHILLTGATGGIGQAIARQLAKSGASLTLAGRHHDALQSLKASLSNQQQHQILVADVTSPLGVASIREYATQSIGQQRRINAVINNAGCNEFALLSSKSPQQIEQEISLNLTAPIMISQALLSSLAQPGVVLNIGSTFGSIGYPGYSTYCAAKAGLHRFSESLDRELSGSGIRVLYLAPRATDTALNSDAVTQMNQKLGNATDTPECVAEHVQAMLEKETAAKWIGWPEKLFARINQILPGVVSASIDKQKEIIHQYVNRVSH